LQENDRSPRYYVFRLILDVWRHREDIVNWVAIDAIAQIIGVIVVVITLIYLAAQVRQGNLLARTQARQRMVEQADRELYVQMSDPSITYANVKDGPLSEEEQAKLGLFFVSFMRQREWEWFQFRDGVIDEDVYRAYHDVIAVHLGTPRGRKWWKNIGTFAFDPAFVTEVDDFLAKREGSNYLRDMRTWDDA
jgi:hypothetical protein